MRRYYYDNWLAKVLLAFSSCHTIAVFWWVLSKRSQERTDQVDRNHETIHAMQWLEMATLTGSAVLLLVLLFGVSPWWLLLAGVFYYIWYVVEWLIKLCIVGTRAYKSIGFEQEAYLNESDSNYVENRHLVTGWLNKVLSVL